jgi:hypothetical protein
VNTGRPAVKIASERRPWWVYGFALAGGLNLTLGVLLAAFQPFRADDLWTIYGWCHQWLYEGVQLYAAGIGPDYPPNAIVTYAVLASVPQTALVTIWTTATIALTVALPWAVLRSSGPGVRAAASSWIVPTVLFACWGGVRTVLQFSQLSLLLAFVAASMPERWIVGGVCLGLALAKPHIAGPIALWAVCTRRIWTAMMAATVVAAEYAIYCLRSGATPMQPILGWLAALGATYSGPRALDGYTSLRPWIVAAVRDQATADAVWIAVSLVTLIVLCVAATRDRTQTLAIPGLLCLWSLLTIYHNVNNQILMLPAFVFLLTLDDEETRIQRWWTIGIMQTALMLDLPVRFRGALGEPLDTMMANADRLLALGIFAAVLWSWKRLQRVERVEPLRGGASVVRRVRTKSERRVSVGG